MIVLRPARFIIGREFYQWAKQDSIASLAADSKPDRLDIGQADAPMGWQDSISLPEVVIDLLLAPSYRWMPTLQLLYIWGGQMFP